MLRLLFSPGGLALAAILLVAWGWATESANPGLLKFQVVNEQIMRFLGRREPADVNSFTIAGFYVFLCIWLMPWTFILPAALYRFWPATRPGREVGAAGRLLLIWAAVILGFFTLSSSRIEYYSLPALPALALILGWRVQRYLDTAKDRVIPWTLLALGLLGLSLLVLLPYLEQVCVDNRREFLGMVSLISPLARQATWVIPAVALAGVLAARLRRPRLAVAAYGVLAVAIAWFTFQTMAVLTPLMCDQAAGEYIQRVASPQDLLIMGPIEEFEYGASLEYYARRHILMVKRNGLPQFPYPVPPAVGLHHHPGTPAGVVAGAPKSLFAPGQHHPAGVFLKRRHRGLDPAGQAPAGQPPLRVVAPRPSPPPAGVARGQALIRLEFRHCPSQNFPRRGADMRDFSVGGFLLFQPVTWCSPITGV